MPGICAFDGFRDCVDVLETEQLTSAELAMVRDAIAQLYLQTNNPPIDITVYSYCNGRSTGVGQSVDTAFFLRDFQALMTIPSSSRETWTT